MNKATQIMNKTIAVVVAAMISGAVLAAGAHAQGTMDKVEGTAKELKGSVKETIGKATGDTKLEWEGKADRVEGTTQNAVGDLKNAAGDVKEKLTK